MGVRIVHEWLLTQGPSRHHQVDLKLHLVMRSSCKPLLSSLLHLIGQTMLTGHCLLCNTPWQQSRPSVGLLALCFKGEPVLKQVWPTCYRVHCNQYRMYVMLDQTSISLRPPTVEQLIS